MDADDEILITGDRAKLPPDVAALTDPSVPLPADVTIYERRFDVSDILMAGAWSVGLAVVGVLAVIFGVVDLIHPSGPVTVYSGSDAVPLGFGLICCLIAWVMASTAVDRMRLRATQAAGRPTRVGIILTADTLIDAGESSWTVVPRSLCRGVSGRTVRYDLKGQEKTFVLPREVIGHSTDEMDRAVAQWVGG